MPHRVREDVETLRARYDAACKAFRAIADRGDERPGLAEALAKLEAARRELVAAISAQNSN